MDTSREILTLCHKALIGYQKECEEPSSAVARVVLAIEQELQRCKACPICGRSYRTCSGCGYRMVSGPQTFQECLKCGAWTRGK